MERESFEDLPGCAETLVIKNLAFSCQLTRAHDGMHRCPADDELGTEVEWPVARPAGVKQETNAERDSARQFKVGSGSPGLLPLTLRACASAATCLWRWVDL
jgi:hypothetical protein